MSKVIPIKKRSTELVVMESSFEKKMLSIKNSQLKKTQEIDHFVVSFKQAMGKTAIAYLELSKLAYDASVRYENDKWAYDYFCEKIGLSKSYLRKLSLIGSRADEMLKHIDFLPNSMNSLYELSQLNEKDFKSVLQKKNQLKELTSFDIAKLNQNKVKKSSSREIEESKKESKSKMINEFAKQLLIEHKYQIDLIEIRYDPKNSLMPAKVPKVVVKKGRIGSFRKKA